MCVFNLGGGGGIQVEIVSKFPQHGAFIDVLKAKDT